MQAWYGSFSHAADEVAPVSYSERTEHDQQGNQTGYRKALTIRGIVHASNPAGVTAALESIWSAYSVDGYDFVLRDNSGNPTMYALLNAQSLGGVRVKDRRLIGGDNTAEYTTYQTYEIDLEAGYPIDNPSQLLTYNETISFIGTGGPLRIYLPCLTGAPQEQIVRQQTTYRAMQVGSAIGYFQYPGYPVPLWPDFVHADRIRQDRTTPQNFNVNGVPTHFGISWSYEFESINPLG